ncbi:hypothetical protein BKK51_10105 [Rodentibacter trehalosifermentans]|uniref:Rha family transcriptional regulator n=1 Tax=Rodentibacter trehalosifermentans TaxID=1908263 RepID=A0A1V3IPM9_9PAST|nr:regulatory protein GemA [Rodentibacter trehalosifermentans]OOF44010.1 hypothetical protein BKK51_10105 [Rodentibacter trehalosifermentans]
MRYTKPKLIQLIHIAKSQFSMDEVSYRAMLERLTGKTSTKQMTITELMKVQSEMENKGFKNTAKGRHSPATAKAKVKSNIAHKIRAIWIMMAKQGLVRDSSETALNAWVRGIANPILARQNKPLALNVAALDDKMASLVLERLKKWQARGEK